MQDERLERVAQIMREWLPGATYHVSRVAEGVSTWVYRVENDTECFYMRILPEEDASFAPEVVVHQRLRAMGASVPEVVHWQHLHPAFDRSVMLTRAIPGRALYSNPVPEVRSIVRAAGRDLACINQMPVKGYGWVRRDSAALEPLLGEYASLSEWLEIDTMPMFEPLHASGALGRQEMQALESRLSRAKTVLSDDSGTYLAHGDFDRTHIFANDGKYTGIIDFGEIRGTYLLYDLGQFAIEDHELLLDLLAGYAEVAPLPADHHERISLATLLIAARRAERIFARRGVVHQPDIDAIRRIILT